MSSSARAYDELLVLMVQRGDRAACERLAARWYPRLLRTARRYTGEEEPAREAVQDAWIAILRGIGRLDRADRFAAWAFRILRRRAADRVRKAVRARPPGEAIDADLAARPASAEDSTAIAQAFAMLGPDQRLTASLFFVEGLSLMEIAAVTEVPEGTVKSRLFAARQHLKTALQGDDT